jgi:hypothetical protein
VRNVLLFNPSAELMLDQTRAVVAALDYAFDVKEMRRNECVICYGRCREGFPLRGELPYSVS